MDGPFGSGRHGQRADVVAPLQDLPLALPQGLELAEEVMKQLDPRRDEGADDDLWVVTRVKRGLRQQAQKVLLYRKYKELTCYSKFQNIRFDGFSI